MAYGKKSYIGGGKDKRKRVIRSTTAAKAAAKRTAKQRKR